MSAADQDAALQLTGRHARHLRDMLDALAAVALSRRPTFSSGRLRRIDVEDLIVAAADAVELRAPRLQITVDIDEPRFGSTRRGCDAC